MKKHIPTFSLIKKYIEGTVCDVTVYRYAWKGGDSKGDFAVLKKSPETLLIQFL